MHIIIYLTFYSFGTLHFLDEDLSHAEEHILTGGKVDLPKLRPITYDPMNLDYLTLGKKVGKAFSDGLKLK